MAPGIAYVAYPNGSARIVVSSVDGEQSWLVSELSASDFFPASWSPDSNYLAFIAEHDIYVSQFDDERSLGPRTQLGAGEISGPKWAPDGTAIAFYYAQSSCCSADVSVLPALGDPIVHELTDHIWAYQESPISWSRNGSRMAIVGDTNSENWNLYVVNTRGSKSTQITDGPRARRLPGVVSVMSCHPMRRNSPSL